MAFQDFVADPRSYFADKAEAVCVTYLEQYNSLEAGIAPANMWWDSLTRRVPNASLVTRLYIPVAGFKPSPWTGSVVFSDTSEVFFDVTRGMQTMGVMADAAKLAEMSFGAFNMSPGAVDKAISKMPQVGLAAALNAGFTTRDWTGTNFFRITATKYNKPGDASLGKWLNAYQNSALTPANIKRAIKNIQSRIGFDGLTLDLEAEFLFVGTNMKEDAKDLVEVMALVPDTDGGSSGGGNTSKVFGRLKVIAVPGMRDDMWIVGAATPDEHMKPLIYVTGGDGSDYEINENAETPGAGVPHIVVIPHLQDSDMYKKHLKMGIAWIINEGYALGTPHAFCASYTGAAS